MPYCQPVTDIIRKRFSCRSYLDKPIEQAKQQQLADFASASTTGPLGARARFGLISATEQDRSALRGLGTYGFIKGATGFMVGAVAQSSKNLEDFGYLLERIVLFATDLGLGTCWLGGTFTKSSFAAKISASDEELVPAVVAVGYISDQPRRLDGVIRRTAGSDHRLAWESLFFDRQFEAGLSREAAGAYAVPLEMVRLGPSASNKQPWRIIRDGPAWHLYLHRTKGYGQNRFGPLTTADLQRVDMGIAMSHFEIVAGELGLKGKWLVHEPAIAKPDELTEYVVSWLSD
jgi:nitroreductase